MLPKIIKLLDESSQIYLNLTCIYLNFVKYIWIYSVHGSFQRSICSIDLGMDLNEKRYV
jgi:hypothetical protein